MTTPPAPEPGIPATVPRRKRCPRPTGRSRSRCRATGTGEFEPQIVPKRARRVGQIDELVLSLLRPRDVDPRYRGTSARGVRRDRIPGIGVEYHRCGDRRNRDLAQSAGRRGVPDRLHRRDPHQGPGQGRGHDQERAPGHRASTSTAASTRWAAGSPRPRARSSGTRCSPSCATAGCATS